MPFTYNSVSDNHRGSLELRCDPIVLCVSLWRHNGHDGVSNHQPHDCLLNRLFRPRSHKTSKLRVTGLCVGNSPGTGEFPTQMASHSENVSIWWRHHIYFHSLEFNNLATRSYCIDRLTNRLPHMRDYNGINSLCFISYFCILYTSTKFINKWYLVVWFIVCVVRFLAYCKRLDFKDYFREILEFM